MIPSNLWLGSSRTRNWDGVYAVRADLEETPSVFRPSTQLQRRQTGFLVRTDSKMPHFPQATQGRF